MTSHLRLHCLLRIFSVPHLQLWRTRLYELVKAISVMGEAFAPTLRVMRPFDKARRSAGSLGPTRFIATSRKFRRLKTIRLSAVSSGNAGLSHAVSRHHRIYPHDADQAPTGASRLSPVQRAIIKCSIAYLVASLFTLVPLLSNMLSTETETDVHGKTTKRPAYSAHMVATIVVYVSAVSRPWLIYIATSFILLVPWAR